MPPPLLQAGRVGAGVPGGSTRTRCSPFSRSTGTDGLPPAPEAFLRREAVTWRVRRSQGQGTCLLPSDMSCKTLAPLVLPRVASPNDKLTSATETEGDVQTRSMPASST